MASGKLSEQEIQFRKRARRRLVGAVVLVLLMITVLPMVLDEHEPRTPQPEIAISIPSQDDTGFASKVVPVAPSVSPAPSAVPLSSTTENSPVENAGSATMPAVGKMPASPPEPSTAAIPARMPEHANPSTAVEGKKASQEKNPAGEIKPTASSATVSTDRPTAETGAYAVQIGVYSDAANVKQLQARLTEHGLQSYTENLATPNGTKIRLRVGPFASRAQAEQSKDMLKAAGMVGMIVPGK